MGSHEGLFDFLSRARRGPSSDRLTPAQIERITLTVNRAPEVIIKVLSKGATTPAAVAQHLTYITRHGTLDLDTDDGDTVRGEHATDHLPTNWSLDLDSFRPSAQLTAQTRRRPARLIHKLVFSMPPGTPPGKLLSAAKNFCSNEFTTTHRYAIVLHTDEPHPHAHVLVKATSEEGVRLNIKKATLRDWRRKFAAKLREQGVTANATDRIDRGQTRSTKRDPIFRATARGDSTDLRKRIAVVCDELSRRRPTVAPHNERLHKTRQTMANKWRAASDILLREGHAVLAKSAMRFVNEMPPPRTDDEWLAHDLLETARKTKTHHLTQAPTR